MRVRGAILAAACLFLAVPASAQTEAEFIAAFAGDWISFEPALATAERCQITLEQERVENRYAVAVTGCAAPLDDLGGWGIVDNQLALLDREGAIRIRLGGNQVRITGRAADNRALVLERAGTQAAAITASAIAGGACLYIGYTASCANVGALALPDLSGTVPAQAEVLVDLNARAEARPDAGIVATIPQGTCVALTQCLEASDGRWCEAQIANASAWVRQQAVRRGQWPVLTYVIGCSVQQ